MVPHFLYVIPLQAPQSISVYSLAHNPQLVMEYHIYTATPKITLILTRLLDFRFCVQVISIRTIAWQFRSLP